MTSDRARAYEALDRLAPWSPWVPFADAAPVAPRTPGVYQVRLRDGSIVYVGMAGERKGEGLQGRLSVYRRGKGAVSGFGEAALDRALADVGFVEDHLTALRDGHPSRTSVWARDAIAWFDVEIRWAERGTKADARALESDAVALVWQHGLWNREAVRRSQVPVPEVSDPAAAGPVDVSMISAMDLARELGHVDGGRAVRRVLREGSPDHVKHSRWDALSPTEVAYVRSRFLTH